MSRSPYLTGPAPQDVTRLAKALESRQNRMASTAEASIPRVPHSHCNRAACMCPASPSVACRYCQCPAPILKARRRRAEQYEARAAAAPGGLRRAEADAAAALLDRRQRCCRRCISRWTTCGKTRGLCRRSTRSWPRAPARRAVPAPAPSATAFLRLAFGFKWWQNAPREIRDGRGALQSRGPG